MANILVTGGTGLIGWRATEALVEAGHHVVVYDLVPNMANVGHLADRLTVVRGDITDLAGLLNTMRIERIDHVLHLAAFLTDQSQRDPAGAFKVHTTGLANVFDASLALGVRRIVWTSSIAVLGVQPGYDGRAVDESYNVVSNFAYGASKWGCEVIARGYRQLGLNIVGFRPVTCYGLGRLSGGVGLFNSAVRNAALGRPAAVPSAPGPLHQAIYNRDMAALLIEALLGARLEHDIYNVPVERNYTDEEVLAIFQRVFPEAQLHIEPTPDFMPAIPVIDYSRALREMPFRPSYALEDGIREMAEFFRRTEG